MSRITKIKKDQLGLYVNCGGYISRPFFGTKFKEGDRVKTHHFGGSTDAGVTSPDKPDTHNFRKGTYEYWGTTGMSGYQYKKKEIKEGYEELFGGKYTNFEEYLELKTKWYEKKQNYLFKEDHNNKFIP